MPEIFYKKNFPQRRPIKRAARAYGTGTSGGKPNCVSRMFGDPFPLRHSLSAGSLKSISTRDYLSPLTPHPLETNERPEPIANNGFRSLSDAVKQNVAERKELQL